MEEHVEALTFNKTNSTRKGQQLIIAAPVGHGQLIRTRRAPHSGEINSPDKTRRDARQKKRSKKEREREAKKKEKETRV